MFLLILFVPCLSLDLVINFSNSLQDDHEAATSKESNMYFQFDLVLSDVSAFLIDGDYHWSQSLSNMSAGSSRSGCVSFLPVVDKCGVIVKLQQVVLSASYLKIFNVHVIVSM